MRKSGARLLAPPFPFSPSSLSSSLSRKKIAMDDLLEEPGVGFRDFIFSVFECLLGRSLGKMLRLTLDDELLK